MSSLPQTAPCSPHTSQEVQRQSAIDLLTVNAGEYARVMAARVHLVPACYRAGLTLEEMAGILDCSVSPVRRLILEARARGEVVERPGPYHTTRPTDGSDAPAGE
jgi:hypothetical protein